MTCSRRCDQRLQSMRPQTVSGVPGIDTTTAVADRSQSRENLEYSHPRSRDALGTAERHVGRRKSPSSNTSVSPWVGMVNALIECRR